MRAAVLHGPGDLRVEEVPDPSPGRGEILIRTRAAAICNATDVHIWEGRLGEEVRPPFPHILGHERAGEVVALGEDPGPFRVGDRVACWAKMDGAFGELDVLRPREHPTVRLDPRLSDDAGAFLEFVGATLRAMAASRLGPGERVMVLGQGVQGILLALEAALLGAGAVVGVDVLPERLERARALGVERTLDLGGLDPAGAVRAVQDLAGGELDLVLDAAGRDSWGGGNSVNLALDALRWGGRYVVYALPVEDLRVSFRALALKGITLKGIDVPPHQVTRLLELGVAWAATGRLGLDGLVTHRVPLDGLVRGLELCRDRPAEVLKVVVDF